MLPRGKEEETLATTSASPSQAQPPEAPEATPAASSPAAMTASISRGAESANDSGRRGADAAPPKTRLLKDVEAEESRYLYKTLYASLDSAADAAVREELTVGDTVRLARKAKEEFVKATTMPLGEKARKCTELMRSFSAKNQQVAYVFIVFSVLMMTMPVLVLLIGMNLIAPWLHVDPTLCGGGLAVFAAMLLMVSYVVYAMMEDAQRGGHNANEVDSKKER
ncbi:hypothetical protein CUR178_01204 [Leishmania enriettii]|uniref:Vacuolar ATPase assembly integral membrane protein n=1 Tax=Leishmania enriettii TaxID=5663 RepID=A0A836GZE3_LEIEN|nr:hypothetical protein CUR178_01204 [Leishmania enriettii]